MTTIDKIEKEVLEEVGWDDKAFEEKLEVLFGKKGVYRDKDGCCRAYPKTETKLSIGYFSALQFEFKMAIQLTIKKTETECGNTLARIFDVESIPSRVGTFRELAEFIKEKHIKKTAREIIKDIEKLEKRISAQIFEPDERMT